MGDDERQQFNRQVKLELARRSSLTPEERDREDEARKEARQKAVERHEQLVELNLKRANPKTVLGLNAKGWIVFTVLLLFCFPLGFIPWLVPALTENK